MVTSQNKRQMMIPALRIAVIIAPLIISFILSQPSISVVVGWTIAQWLPLRFSVRATLLRTAWDHWDRASTTQALREEIPKVEIQKHRHHLLEHLETTYGKHWRKQPLLLQGLWTEAELRDEQRQLSEKGLLQQALSVPYFTDSSIPSLTPDARAPIQDIVTNITNSGEPHKIGTQLLVQAYPKLIEEVAPVKLVTVLFGDHFTPDRVVGSGPFQLFPATTTVPLFVAGNSKKPEESSKNETTEQKPFTALHCEPIGNVAVQLSGQKEWTLVLPEYSWQIQPTVAPDGRAFFASWKNVDELNVPTYRVITQAGDALWVPTWTWHRVDYIPSRNLAIGASLFHFRAADFFSRNPLFAALMLPAIFMELVGYNTQ